MNIQLIIKPILSFLVFAKTFVFYERAVSLLDVSALTSVLEMIKVFDIPAVAILLLWLWFQEKKEVKAKDQIIQEKNEEIKELLKENK